MTKTERPFAFERDLPAFDRITIDAQREIAHAIQLALKTGDYQSAGRRRMQLARVLAILDQLGGATDPLARRLVADAYQQAADRAASQIATLGITVTADPGAFAGISREAVQALQESITSSLAGSRSTIGRQTMDVYAKAGRRAALRAVLGVDPSPVKARRSLMTELLKDRDVARMVTRDGTGFVDRAGRKWALDTYSSMAVRTVTREAAVQGAIARMASHGITLARWLVSESACIQCKPYANRLIDLAGNGQDYGGEAVMTGPIPPLHPNCTCALAPVATRVERGRRDLAGAVA